MRSIARWNTPIGLAFIAWVFLASFGLAKGNQTLGVRLYPQEKSNWCWAACGQMVMAFLGNNVTQPDQANALHGNRTADKTGYPEFEKFGFNRKIHANPLSWNDVVAEINNNRPLCFVQRFKGGGEHMLVIHGYEIRNNARWLYILNPAPKGKGDWFALEYETYADGTEAEPPFSHSKGYTEIKKGG